MKLGKRLMSLALALVMVLGLTAGASAATATNVKVLLSPDIIVKFNGFVQSMEDVNGDPVYPVLYDGTTYLPVRAVSDMLGLQVDWDGATRTVLLDKPSDLVITNPDNGSTAPADAKPTSITVQIDPGITVKYDGKVQTMGDVNGNPVYPMMYDGTTYLPIRAVSDMLKIGVDWDGATRTVLLQPRTIDPTKMSIEEITAMLEAEGATPEEIQNILSLIDQFGGGAVIDMPELVGEKHLAAKWAELDWSTADDSYIRVKVNEQLTVCTGCEVEWENEDGSTDHSIWILPAAQVGKWVNIPLTGGSAQYTVSVSQFWDMGPEPSQEELRALCRNPLETTLTAEIEDPDARYLLSHIHADYENAPKTCAKALELTKNCKTDAEKITAVYEYVAKTVTYDWTLYNREKARIKAGETALYVYGERDLNPDNILANRKGVCLHYAVLMTAMLRSVGVPCKLVSGTGGGESHAWVAVKPETGTLDKTALGAGNEADGWIRLDPTWGHTAAGRIEAAKDSKYSPDSYY